MLRMLTAGESHGKALVAVLEGLPAGVPVDPGSLEHQLARRRHGHGRGGRQRFESDRFEILSGVRHGRTLGSPIAVTIPNLEFDAKYAELMGVTGEMDPAKRLTRPRPGHADLVGSQKYGFDDVRNVLERASARETAARVTVGTFCRGFLTALGIEVVSHVVRIGSVKVRARGPVPRPEDAARVDRSPVRCFDVETSSAMVAEIDRRRKERDTVGGVFEVLAYGAPPGLGSHVHYDRKLDARLALALMSIQSVKGVEFGDGFAAAAKPGSKAHDEIVVRAGRMRRASARAGGIEGGMSTGEPITVRAAMKPFSTVPKPLATVDIVTGEPAVAIKQRTDVCAVPAGGVVGESAVAFELAAAVLEKFGGDSLPETRDNLDRYLEGLA
ncbi:MAG TPA: chorismate synthase [Actinomycetota bacterium]|jgi:chorismate synthase|nr:chorismate synthase [Actinomycetota bacterium]